MPARPKSICRRVGCGATIALPGFCERHKTESVGWNRTHQGKTSTERGYGSKWRKVRERVMLRDCGLCQICIRAGVIRSASEVDHITNKATARAAGWTEEQIDDETNLQAVCSPCHKTKTLTERTDKGRG